MPAKIVIGTQWGDEGKGKVVDYLAEKSDLVARYQGGDNAGHTVVVKDKEFRFHLMPSGVIREKRVVLGNGMVINPGVLLEEIRRLQENGIEPNMLVSKKAHVILPFHRKLDGIKEKKKGKKFIGTTKKGIGPTYCDKASRIGLRIGDLLDKNILKAKLETIAETKNIELAEYGEPPIDINKVFEEYAYYGQQLIKYAGDASLEINQALDQKKQVLIEGAQGTHLDIDHGTYPYVTSSNTIAGGACSGLGLGPKRINEVIGITKAYTTRVGEGDFPTELNNEIGKTLQEKGNEFGTTTGRPRRCGWFDSVLVKYSCRLSAIDWLALMKLDVLTGINPIKICTEYKHKVTEQTTKDFPQTLEELSEYEPVYEEMPGWKEKPCKKLPDNAKTYIKKIEQLCGTPVKIVSIGPKREETIIIK